VPRLPVAGHLLSLFTVISSVSTCQRPCAPPTLQREDGAGSHADRYAHLMPDAHAAEARKLDRLVLGDSTVGSRSAGTHGPDAPGADRGAESKKVMSPAALQLRNRPTFLIEIIPLHHLPAS
jgi:hypothetical protein